MSEFILSCYKINLKIVCHENIMNKIKTLMFGHCQFKESSDNITYTLIIEKPIDKKLKQSFEITDKWFNACGKVYIDDLNNAIYLTDVFANTEKNQEQFVQYFVCNVLNRLLEEKGFYGFHASAVSKNNVGMAFIGERGCGKTNSLLNMLHNGYDFLTNDKLAIQYNGKNINEIGRAHV